MKYYRIINAISAVLTAAVITAVLLMISCTKAKEPIGGESQEIRFQTFLEEGGQIRPVEMTRSLTANPLSNGYYLCGLLSTVDYPASFAYERLMWNVAMNADGSYKSTSKYFWPEGNTTATRHSFVAYSAIPTGASGTTIAAPTGATTAQPVPSVVYTHASDPAAQVDLLYADNAKNITFGSSAPLVRLVFKHRLTRLRLKLIGTGGIPLTSCQAKITYKASAVRNAATLPLSSDALVLSSTFHSGTYNLGASFTLPGSAISPATAIEMGDMILIPQNLAADWATLTLSYIPDGGVSTQTVSVALPQINLSAAMGLQYDLLVNVIEESQNLTVASVTLAPWNDKTSVIDPDQSKVNPPKADQYVTINGLKWTKGNLVADGANACKVGASTDYGLYFHFGSLVGWAGGANGDGTGAGSPALSVKVKPKPYGGSSSWPAGYYTGGSTGTGYALPTGDDAVTGSGDPCRYYLGAPWRTPTAAEYTALVGTNGANTNKGVPLTVSGLTFPGSGCRTKSTGSLETVGSNGLYGSSSVSDSSSGLTLIFSTGSVSPQSTGYHRPRGYTLRCVAN